MKKKIYDVIITPRKGRVWTYQVEAYGKFSAMKAALFVKRKNKYKGITKVYPVETD